jgi:hypothetical protein
MALKMVYQSTPNRMSPTTPATASVRKIVRQDDDD